MATLENVSGASFIPNLARAFKTGREGFERIEEKERVAQQKQDVLTRIDTITRAGEDADEIQRARIELAALDPKVAQAVTAVIESGNAEAIQKAQAEVDRGLRTATQVMSKNNIFDRKAVFGEAIADKISKGLDVSEDLKTLDLEEDEFNIRMERMIRAGTDAKTLLAKPKITTAAPGSAILADGRQIGQVPAAPTASQTISKVNPKDFTGASMDKFSKSGSFQDLELSDEAKASLNRTGKFVTGDSTLFKNAKGQTFIATPVTDKEAGTTSINVNRITTPGGEQGIVASRALGETPAEKEAREIRTAGGKTREELLAEIKLKPDLTRIQKQQQRDFVEMDAALEAAGNVPLLRQNLILLQRIKTGGVNAIILAAARKLGVESADQAELTFNLRTNVLKQLKPTFGAQFTEREGKLLAEIQAAETKSTAGNIRLVTRALEIYDRAIQRGLRSARRQGDTAQIEEIEAAMAEFKNLDEADLAPLAPVPGAAVPAPSGTLPPGQKQELERLRKKLGR